jgi:uncharacterized repeat protein (TIGR02543 family)
MQGKRSLARSAACVLTSLVLTVGLMPLPAYAGSSSTTSSLSSTAKPPSSTASSSETGAVSAQSASSATSAGSSTTYRNLDDDSLKASIAQSESTGECAAGEALVVYHSSGAAKGATGALTTQSESDPLAQAGFVPSATWDLSAADSAAASSSAAADGALSVQSEGTGLTLASGSDVRVALVDRPDLSTSDLVAQLDSLSFVECAQPNYTHELCSLSYTTPNDPLYTGGLQWAFSDATGGIGYSAELAADNATASTQDNIVAVIDSGFDYTNPDLANNMWSNPGNIAGAPGEVGTHGYDFYENDDDPMPGITYELSHGTHCAGLVAAQTNNSLGIAGTAQHTKVMACKAASDSGIGPTDKAIVAAYEYIIAAKTAGQNLVAISNSWHIGEYAPVLDYLVNQAGKAGVMSLFAASNSGVDTATTFTSTSVDLQSPYAIVVASVNADGTLSSFSNYNATAVDVAAPGGAVLSTVRKTDAKTVVGNGDDEFKYDATAALLTGKTPTYSKQMGELLDASGKVVSGASIKLLHSDDKTTWTDASTADQGHLAYASDASSGISKLKLTLSAIDALSDRDISHYRVQVSWTDANPFLNKTVTASDYFFANAVSQPSTSPSSSLVTGTLDISGIGTCSSASKTASSEINNDSVSNAYGTFESIDTSAPTLTATEQISITSDATPRDVTFYADAVAIDVPTDTPDYEYMSGTSMATPMLAGCYAELASLYPNESALQLRGRICGGANQLVATKDSSGNKKQTASDGYFTFDKALGTGSNANANTWSISTDVAAGTITVHGYNLNRATLIVDQSGTVVSPEAQSASEITFADASLLDGKAHRFDVTDTSTGRIYQASYVVPLGSAASTQITKAGALPVESASGTGALVSATDRLFFADAEGVYLYSCTDPANASSAASWTKLAPANTVFANLTGLTSAKLRYAYRDGKLYAFCIDWVRQADSSYLLDALMATYDIETGTWSQAKAVGALMSSAAPSGVIFRTLASSSQGQICLVVSMMGGVQTYAQAASFIFTLEPGSDAVTMTAVPTDKVSDIYGIAAAYRSGSTSYFLGIKQSTNAVESISYDGTTWTDKGALAGEPAMTANQSRDQMGIPTVVTGNGLFRIGAASYENVGDATLIDPVAGTWTGLGSLLGTSTSQITVSSGAMLDGKIYLSGVDEPALYTLPSSVAAKLATTDVTLTASAQTGGTATVQDWRGEAAGTLGVRGGDTATWTATADAGYAFAGWYGADGNKVSPDATYAASATSAATLTARFSANSYTVAFDANGGTGTMAGQPMTYGVAQRLAASAFARAGYTFAGWNTRADGTGTAYADGATVESLAAEDGATVTLYAQWKADAVPAATPAAAATGASAASPSSSTPSTGDPAPSWPAAPALAALGAACLGMAARRRRAR